MLKTSSINSKGAQPHTTRCAQHCTPHARQQQQRPSPSPASLSHASAAAAVAASVTLLLHASPAIAAADHSWPPCPTGRQCVSTNSFMSPAQYLPPWLFQPDSQQAALRSLLDELSARSAQVLQLDEAAGYILAQVPVSPGAGKEYDTLELLLLPDGVVLFKSQGSVDKPYPPFCMTPGCISGPANRQRLEALRDDLGWTVMEPDEDKKWVQILLH